jgi:hypothetical protein
MQFKELELSQQESKFKRTLQSAHFKKSVIAILVGATASFAFFYATEGKLMDTMLMGDILRSMAPGAFLGFFLTNSPCARGRC